MITPGFFGLFNAQRGLIAAQIALNTVGHNISNANTPGYSRQRVDISQAPSYALPTNFQDTANQLGQGPTVLQITRSKDAYLDGQYRLANAKLGMNSTGRDALGQVEGIISEPTPDSLNNTLQTFFDSAQEMSLHPESTATRTSFVQQALDMVSIFQLQANQFSDLRKNLVGDPVDTSSFATSQLAVTVSDINSKLSAITDLNNSIVSIMATGAKPNDLMDQRDKLLDDLSSLVDMNVKNYDNGQIDLSIGGITMIQGGHQIESLEVIQNPGPAPVPDDVPSLVRTVTGQVVLNDGAGQEITSGKLKGIIDMGGNDPNITTIRSILGKLDTLLNEVVTQVNTLQTAGRDENGNLSPPAIFQQNAALNPGQPLNIFHWEVTPGIVTDPSQVAAAIDDSTAPSGFAGVGDGRNATAMAQLRDQTFAALGTNFTDYLTGSISKLSVDSSTYQNASKIQQNLTQSIDLQRQAMSGVNVDEETIDLLRYQRAFEATSKTIKTLDEVTQTIINML